MPSATFSDLQTRVLHRMAAYAGDVGLGPVGGANNILGELVNSALTFVSLQADWPWQIGLQTFNTIPNIVNYPVPGDWLRTYSLVAVDVGDPMHLRTVGELDEVIFMGRPRIYTIDQEQIYLKPIPDGPYAMEHRYVSTENFLVNSTDTPKIPRTFDEGVVEMASVYGLRHLRQEDRAKAAEAGYQAWLKVALDNKLRTREHPRVRVRPGNML